MSSSQRSFVVLFHLIAAPVSGLIAQWLPEIAPGARVRARVPEVQYQQGGTRGHFGFATGAVMGAAIPQERWKSVRLGVSVTIRSP